MGTGLVVGGATYYGLSDNKNAVRKDIPTNDQIDLGIHEDEKRILYLASLAPSGHNTQPWFVQYVEPFHWVVGNDKSRWLPGVDPTQRETILSIGAFLQTLEYAANGLGYALAFRFLATTNQAEQVADVLLTKTSTQFTSTIAQIQQRRTIRSNYQKLALSKEHTVKLIGEEESCIHYIPNGSNENGLLNEQTIEANRTQAYRDPAQQELSNWIRFSSKDAMAHLDGLTLAGMELTGMPAWYLRNFYHQKDVMTKSFREQSIDTVVQQVSSSAGWIIITSIDYSVAALLDAGKRMQRLCLKVRALGIAIHPMTQILEESPDSGIWSNMIGSNQKVQFILRTGYIKTYPQPVTLRRPVSMFLRKNGYS